MNYWPAEEARRQTRWYDCALLSSNQRRREGRRERGREEGRTDKNKKKREGSWKHMSFVGTLLLNGCKEKKKAGRERGQDGGVTRAPKERKGNNSKGPRRKVDKDV